MSSPTLCIIGGCNGAGKSTLARELLPRIGIERFLNADLIAKGLSPVNPSLAAFAAGRRLLDVKLLRGAKERGFDRSVRHFAEDYLPLADEWGLWENAVPPAVKIAIHKTHTKQEAIEMITSSKLQEPPVVSHDQVCEAVLEASRVATAKMLDLYARMGIKVTPHMTLADDSPPPAFKPFEFW